ncbi:uncharacterized protein [Nicotiana sylvestris]|uniref:uncharacterized protein n=1 Tax=Nicotiana sylvestris TaxID=4096 RepID=UPI00388CE6D1
MYHDLKEVYWWNNMKRDVADFVAKCLNCQQVKAEHQRPGGLLQSIEIPMWKWEMINMNFVVGLPRTTCKFDSIWAERTIRTFEDMLRVCALDFKGPDLVHQDMEKVKVIKERLKTTQSCQKSYSNVRRRDLEFKEDDWVFLKVSPMKGVMRFGKKGKLSPR